MIAKGGRLELRDWLRVASVGLRARPLRAALSALGIAIGTAAIVGVLGLSSSSQAGLIAQIIQIVSLCARKGVHCARRIVVFWENSYVAVSHNFPSRARCDGQG